MQIIYDHKDIMVISFNNYYSVRKNGIEFFSILKLKNNSKEIAIERAERKLIYDKSNS